VLAVEAQAAETDRVVHPGQAGIETRAEELDAVGAGRVVAGQ
jgi:hypothetical protein